MVSDSAVALSFTQPPALVAALLTLSVRAEPFFLIHPNRPEAPSETFEATALVPFHASSAPVLMPPPIVLATDLVPFQALSAPDLMPPPTVLATSLVPSHAFFAPLPIARPASPMGLSEIVVPSDDTPPLMVSPMRPKKPFLSYPFIASVASTCRLAPSPRSMILSPIRTMDGAIDITVPTVLVIPPSTGAVPVPSAWSPPPTASVVSRPAFSPFRRWA